MRPLWRCRACGADWPCQPARLALLAEYRGRRSALLAHQGKLLAEATDQLSRLNGTRPDLRERFVNWCWRAEPEHPTTSAFESGDLDPDVVFRGIEMIIRSHWGGRTCPRCVNTGCPHLDWADGWLARLRRAPQGRPDGSRTPYRSG
ncbi:flavin reductase [Salinispora vitiensis]|uniref:flavin reductase n=1 Tax=Salinispora vitiensis TaxID=999544 RepID=UPI0009B7D1C6|nr:flavin reductase [Salinispora vitiensis]